MRVVSRKMLNSLALAHYGALTRQPTTVASGTAGGRRRSIECLKWRGWVDDKLLITDLGREVLWREVMKCSN